MDHFACRTWTQAGKELETLLLPRELPAEVKLNSSQTQTPQQCDPIQVLSVQAPLLTRRERHNRSMRGNCRARPPPPLLLVIRHFLPPPAARISNLAVSLMSPVLLLGAGDGGGVPTLFFSLMREAQDHVWDREREEVDKGPLNPFFPAVYYVERPRAKSGPSQQR